MINKKGIEYRENVIYGPQSRYEPDSRGLGFFLFECLKNTPKTQLAQIDTNTGEADTNEVFLQRCIRTALYLRSKGIKEGDIITICSENHLNTAPILVASQFVGAINANLDPILPIKDMTYLLNLAKPKIIFASKTCQNQLQIAIGTLTTEIQYFNDEFNNTVNDPHPNEIDFEPHIISSLDAICAICFSSGSTGLPKGACLSHRAMILQTYGGLSMYSSTSKLSQDLVEQESRIVLHSSSLYWVSAFLIIFFCISRGECRLIWKFNPDEFWDIIDMYKPFWAKFLPVEAIALCKTKEKKHISKETLSICRISGAPINLTQMLKIQETFSNCYVYQGYGMTEACGTITGFDTCNESMCKMMEQKPMSCGMPVQDFIYKIVDLNTGEVLGPNQEGELWVKSPTLLNGYYGMDPKETFEEDGWLKTGDIMYYDEEFCFFVVGRNKEMLKYDGWVISPAIIEMELLSHPAVKKAVVIGIPHTNGDHAMGLVVLEDNADTEVTPELLEKYVESRVHEKQRLRAGVKFLDTFPVTATGKIKRRELRDMIINGQM